MQWSAIQDGFYFPGSRRLQSPPQEDITDAGAGQEPGHDGWRHASSQLGTRRRHHGADINGFPFRTNHCRRSRQEQ